ncbi:MAG: hypothetical protein ACI892_001778, partial [Marinobacter maritimus]
QAFKQFNIQQKKDTNWLKYHNGLTHFQVK